MSRALINNPKLAAKISQDFIPYGGSIERLQPSRYGGRETTTSRWFQKQAKRAFAKYAPDGWWEQFKTYQGFYVLGPDGKVYSYLVVWQLTPDKVIQELDKALARYKQDPPKSVSIPSAGNESRPLRPKPGTSILRVFSRIRPFPRGAAVSNKGIGRDHMWVTQSEVRQILKTGDLPKTVIARLVRFQLLDNVRNVSPGFDPAEVKTAKFRSQLIGETLTFQGAFESVGKTEAGHRFGMKGNIEGRLIIDRESLKIKQCRAYATTEAFGESTPEAPQKPYKMVFAIVDAYDEVGRSVPPTTYGISPLFRNQYLKPEL